MIEFSNVKAPKAFQLIAQQIREAIVSGKLNAGDRLPPERELIKQIGYSRAVVREALRLLEQEGLIALSAGRNGGATVVWPGTERIAAQLDVLLRLQDTDFDELFEGRRLLELLAVELAAERATPEDISGLREAAAALEIRGSREQGRVHTARFHTLLTAATHNTLIAVLGSMVQDLIHSVAMDDVPENLAASAHAHRRIIDAIERGDLAAARRRTLRHLDAVEKVAREQRKLLADSGNDYNVSGHLMIDGPAPRAAQQASPRANGPGVRSRDFPSR